jgi:hypothetical protein
MIGLVFLCTSVPHIPWLDRILALDADGYEKHVVTDLESEPLPQDMLDKYSSIKFHQVHRVFVTAAGYWDYVFPDRNNLKFMSERNPCVWEKALFLHRRWDWGSAYSHVWFIEYDVMFGSPKTISNIDKAHPTADLLSASDIPRTSDPHWPWWGHAMLPEPLFHSMTCAFRGSANLLHAVHAFAQAHRKLFQLEMILNSLCHQHNLVVETPPQMSKIVYRHDWTDADVGADDLVHPIKDWDQQERIWSKLNLQ